MRRTGTVYDTMLGPFDSSKGDLRLVNVSAGYGGDSYITYSKVPSKLKEFCEWLNTKRQSIDVTNPETIYRLSFEAHLRLVTIHPWVDGNGRMSRLLMNHIQFEYDLIPTVILKEDKEQYIKALKKSQSDDDPTYFVEYMITIQKRNLFNEVVKFKETLEKGINAKSG